MKNRMKKLLLTASLALPTLLAIAVPAKADIPTGHFVSDVRKFCYSSDYTCKTAVKRDLLIQKFGDQYLAAEFLFEDSEILARLWAIEQTQSGLLAFKLVIANSDNPGVSVRPTPGITGEVSLRKIRGGQLLTEIQVIYSGGALVFRPALNPLTWGDLDLSRPYFGTGVHGQSGEISIMPSTSTAQISSASTELAGSSKVVRLSNGLLATRRRQVNLETKAGETMANHLGAFLIPVAGNGFGGRFLEIRALAPNPTQGSDWRPVYLFRD